MGFFLTENHRLESAYQNHLILKLVLVSETKKCDNINIKVFIIDNIGQSYAKSHLPFNL